MIDKESFFKFARQLRGFYKQKCDNGASGVHGGCDGEMSSSCMIKAIRAISEDIIAGDKDAFACDVGHGTGIAAYAYFNKPLNLPVIGIENNTGRCKSSWIFQDRMLRDAKSNEDFKKVAAMSRFFLGDGLETMKKLFGTGNPANAHLKLLYWFRKGWSEHDIRNVIEFACATFSHLSWIICDMSAEKLIEFGFNGVFISPTEKVHGSMNKSPSSRTLYVHNVKMKCPLTNPKATNFDFATTFKLNPKECLDSLDAECPKFHNLRPIKIKAADENAESSRLRGQMTEGMESATTKRKNDAESNEKSSTGKGGKNKKVCQRMSQQPFLGTLPQPHPFVPINDCLYAEGESLLTNTQCVHEDPSAMTFIHTEQDVEAKEECAGVPCKKTKTKKSQSFYKSNAYTMLIEFNRQLSLSMEKEFEFLVNEMDLS